MARPKREIIMARCAASALLAAIEIYNKPTVEYREQTLALLVTNAWEVLLKARIVQQSGGKLETLYRREPKSERYVRDKETQEPRTIGLRRILSQFPLPDEVKANIKGLMEVRNRAAHMGVLSAEVRERILGFGTASVHNFVKLSTPMVRTDSCGSLFVAGRVRWSRGFGKGDIPRATERPHQGT